MPEALHKKIDWVIAGIWLLLVVFGWMNIYASSLSEDGFTFSLKEKYIMDMIWVATAMMLGFLILFIIPSSIYPPVALPFYALMVLLLVAVAFVADAVRSAGRPLVPMGAAAQDFIAGWESEKYRRKLSERSGK